MSEIALGPATRLDARDLIQANLDSRAHHAPWAQPFTDEAGFDAWFAQQLTGPNVGLVARHASTGGVVGVFNINQIVAGAFQSAFLGYYGMAAYARRGLMTEALRLSTRYAFGALGLHRLEANIQPDNLASIALARRAGFRMEGFSPQYLRIGGAWCDHERWALLASEAIRPA